jgi:hypothetical protein
LKLLWILLLVVLLALLVLVVLVAEARQRTSLPCNFKVLFYEGKYFSSFGSIFPVEDIIDVIPAELVSTAVLGWRPLPFARVAGHSAAERILMS